MAFVVPYLLEEIGANIGWIFGGFSIIATVYAYWRVPEISGRSLEELDELFENKVPARKFATTETHGAAHRITELENRKALVPIQRDEEDGSPVSPADESKTGGQTTTVGSP